jgi:AcrR family transcriptional regulator
MESGKRETGNREPGEGAEPKRLRGHIRVAAILQAAGGLFAEQGYDAVTMTEIAARSQTAIGSLYRFFPTKEVLADALLKRFGERIDAELAELARQARDLPLDALADALVAHALAWAPERAAALVLIEARQIGGARRGQIRQRMQQRAEDIVRGVNPGLTDGAAATRAKVLRRLIKSVAADCDEGSAYLAEMRALFLLYLRERVSGA